jgi:hypothetical protein
MTAIRRPRRFPSSDERPVTARLAHCGPSRRRSASRTDSSRSPSGLDHELDKPVSRQGGQRTTIQLPSSWLPRLWRDEPRYTAEASPLSIRGQCRPRKRTWRWPGEPCSAIVCSFLSLRALAGYKPGERGEDRMKNTLTVMRSSPACSSKSSSLPNAFTENGQVGSRNTSKT